MSAVHSCIIYTIWSTTVEAGGDLTSNAMKPLTYCPFIRGHPSFFCCDVNFNGTEMTSPNLFNFIPKFFCDLQRLKQVIAESFILYSHSTKETADEREKQTESTNGERMKILSNKVNFQNNEIKFCTQHLPINAPYRRLISLERSINLRSNKTMEKWFLDDSIYKKMLVTRFIEHYAFCIFLFPSKRGWLKNINRQLANKTWFENY